MNVRILLFAFLFCLISNFIQAKHIIGGEIFYTCVSINSEKVTFKFTMNIYRDCASGGADFDPKGAIGFYVKNSNQSYSLYQATSWNLKSREELESNNPCVITPPSLCVEKGVYEGILDLPIIDKPYVVAYQRCCRNESISNIINPGDFGAAYTVEISPEAQRLCNNSPTFKNFPPIIICNNSEINFDHSAIDVDGDVISYEFCAPLHAGGKNGSNGVGSPLDCNGVTPSPGNCPPPYTSVIFKTPFFTSLTPMAGNPTIQINPVSGLITGVPTNQGQYVVGVCIKEYRNGVLLSDVRRDFQFNVIDCQKAVSAQIISDSVQSSDRFILNACGDKTVNLLNTSTIASLIRTYEWEFIINGTKQSFNSRDLSLTLPDLGQYTGYLYLNRGDKECSDTANITINVFPGINADYNHLYDTCLAGPIQFTDLSTALLSKIVDWNYILEPGVNNKLQNPSYEFKTPGIKRVTLQIIDENGCKDNLTKEINYYPVPATVVVNPNSFDGCQPLDVFFDNLSFPIDSTYDIDWDFGDGTSSKEISPSHTYLIEGNFSVGIKIKSPIGCSTNATFSNLISVRSSPTADFDFNPGNLSNFNKTINLTDRSLNSEKHRYIINNNKIILDRNTTYTFQDTGIQTIMQIVSRLNGCSDTLIQTIDVEPKVTYYMPNAFTPNGSGPNEFFLGVGRTEYIGDFGLSIWDRWGSLIYKTNDPFKGWNGRFDNSGELLPPGVYIYTVQYSAPRNQSVSLKGYATLLR